MNRLEPGDITVIVWSPAGRLTLLRDALYAITALARTTPRAIVVAGPRDTEDVEVTTRLIGHFEGLLDIRVIPLPDGPMSAAAAFNRGLAEVSTEFCTLQRDDHVLYPRHAAVLVDALHGAPSGAVAYGGGFRCWGRLTPEAFLSERKQRWHAQPFDRARILRESFIALPASVLRTDRIRATGARFEATLDDLEDWSFLRQLARHHDFVAVDQPVGEHRVLGAESEEWPVVRPDPGDHRNLSRSGLQAALRAVYRAFQRRHRGS